MGWGDTSTAGDPGEQSAADASQSASVDSATAGSNAGSIGGVGGNNDSNQTGTMDPGQMQAAGLNAGYGFAAQDAYNTAHGITATNPYGKQGFFSRFLGIDPNNIDYSNNMGLSTRVSIANNQFSKFANPQNTPGQLGYNPQYASAPAGQLRSGVQKEGYKTAYGPVMGQAREQTIDEMIARGAMGLAGGLPGLALGQIGTTEYGLPAQAGYQGLPGFDSFDPNNPRAGGGILGTMLGGLNPTQAKDALVGAFAPVAPAPTPTSIGTAPADLKGFENRFSQHPLTGETTTTVPGQRISTVSTTGGIDAATAKKADEILGPSSLSYDFFTDPEVEAAYPQASAETQQVAGLGGSSTANQLAQVDYSNLSNVGGNMYQAGQQKSAFDSFLETFGMKEAGRRPSGQIYSPAGKNKSFFDYIGFGQ